MASPENTATAPYDPPPQPFVLMMWADRSGRYRAVVRDDGEGMTTVTCEQRCEDALGDEQWRTIPGDGLAASRLLLALYRGDVEGVRRG